jgi:hypothetical protein
MAVDEPMPTSPVERLARWLDAPVASDLADDAIRAGALPLLTALLDLLDARAAVERAAGRVAFRPADARFQAPDRWLDTIEEPALTPLVDQVIGSTVRGGRALLPAQIAWLEGARHALVAASEARWAVWRATPRVIDRYVLWSREALPDALRTAFDGHPACRQHPAGIVDSRLQPPEIAAALLAAAPVGVRVLHGDNRDACRLLQAEGAVLHAVLEDPPYDTGLRDLPYRDHWPAGAWTAMMREHLQHLRGLLPAEGVVALHIDEHRGAALDLLLHEVFGAGRIGLAVWDKRNPKGDASGLGWQHELIGLATRDRKALEARGGLRRRKRNAERMLAKAAELVGRAGAVTDEARQAFRRWVHAQPDLSGGERAYQHLDEAGRVYRPVSMAWPNRTLPPPPFFEPLIHPRTGEPCPVPARGWRNAPETMARLRAEDRLLFGEDHRAQPTRKYLLEDVQWERLPSVIAHGGSEDKRLAGFGLRFPHAKPIALLAELLEALAPDPQAVVADLFAGSGSTAHALLDLNRRTGASRQVVLGEADPEVLQTQLLPRLTALLRGLDWHEGAPAGPRGADAVWVEVIAPAEHTTGYGPRDPEA